MSLWNIFQNKKRISSSHKRIYNKPTYSQRASFCTCPSGSYTLEAAIVIPLVAAYLVTLLFFFHVLEIQCEVDEALLYVGRKTAVESSVVDSDTLLFLSAEAYFVYALQDSQQVEKWVEHGIAGIYLWKSVFNEETIHLHAEYVIKLPISIWGIDELKLTSRNTFRKWIGDRQEEVEEGYVYVTKYGEVYHKNLNCRTINISVKVSTVGEIFYLRGKDGQKYYECSRCTWTDSKRERVYYTDYGTLYHKDIACSAIKRTVDKIKEEEIGQRRPCSYCYEE